MAVIGTDTGVGKTRAVQVLVRGLRAYARRRRRVWVHKPVACGGWEQGQAEDARVLAEICGDGQLVETVCPFQFQEPASPHVAAHAEGVSITMDQLLANLDRIRMPALARHDLVIEGIGGLMVPLTAQRETVCDYLLRAQLPAIVVTRPDLGTLNHTTLTVECAKRRGIPLLGLVLNHAMLPHDTLAIRTAAQELMAVTELPILAELSHAPSSAVEKKEAASLAAAVLVWQASRTGVGVGD